MMPTKQSARQMKFNKESIKRVTLDFNIRTDADILARLDAQESKTGYIKAALREYIANHPEEPKAE